MMRYYIVDVTCVIWSELGCSLLRDEVSVLHQKTYSVPASFVCSSQILWLRIPPEQWLLIQQASSIRPYYHDHNAH